MNNSLYINGQWQTANGAEFTSTNPVDDEILWQGASATYVDVESAVDAATQAFPAWSRLSIQQRFGMMQHFNKQLAAVSEEFAIVISKEIGKPLWESRQEVWTMLKKLDQALDSYNIRCTAKHFQREHIADRTQYRAHGVMAVFGTFNLPGRMSNGHIVPALLAGNTIVFKPSEHGALTGEFLTKLWQKSSLPEGVFNLVQGGINAGQALAASSRVSGIFFTGSYEVGREIHRQSAGHPQKILSLEMGGNNPLIVTNIDDLQAAVYLTICSTYMTSGQRCVCARRLILPTWDRREEFIELLLKSVEAIKIGSWQKEGVFMGPVVSRNAASKLLRQQQSLIDQGATILKKMTPDNHIPTLLSPGIIDVTDIENRHDEEIFGPLLQIIRVDTFQQAIDEANNTSYGLAAGLFCDKPELFEQFFAQIQAGIVKWNQPFTGSSPQAPFGGTGNSGNHRPASSYSADNFSYPIASMESPVLCLPSQLNPGIEISALGSTIL